MSEDDDRYVPDGHARGLSPHRTNRPGIPCLSCGIEVAPPPGLLGSPSTRATCSGCVPQHLPRTRRIRRAIRVGNPYPHSTLPLRKAA